MIGPPSSTRSIFYSTSFSTSIVAVISLGPSLGPGVTRFLRDRPGSPLLQSQLSRRSCGGLVNELLDAAANHSVRVVFAGFGLVSDVSA